ncbi:MAG: competence/damage-inducible protein A [Chloroflexi bacterium]|nr:competence/damage-inducible protein A [Chloroflexota bacterium]
MKAEILSVGTEMLLGQILDTNAQFLAQQLAALGIDMYYVSQVGDNQGRVVETVRRALGRSDLVVVTGGLGPTEDDLTREAVAEALGEELRVDPKLERELRDFFTMRGRTMPERNVKQASLISSASGIPNPIGTAPGWWVEKNGKTIVCMPGVPVEMRKMWEEQAVPRLQQRYGGQVIVSRTLKVAGLGESHAEAMVLPIIRSLNPTLATYAKEDGVHLRLTAKAPDRAAAERLLDAFEPQVRALIGDYVYGYERDSLAGVMGNLLQRQGLSLACMESCTGGLLSSTITDVPGSSAYFRGGIVAYSTQVKLASGVDAEVLRQHGTVGAETAAAMARAARERLGAEVGLATTGVAGPDEVEGKPVGTLHVALDFRGEVEVDSGRHMTTRGVLKRRAVMQALFMAWSRLKREG